MFLEGNTLPNQNYETKNILCPISMEYEKIHLCSNDCILYRKKFEELRRCLKCGLTHYKVKNGQQ